MAKTETGRLFLVIAFAGLLGYYLSHLVGSIFVQEWSISKLIYSSIFILLLCRLFGYIWNGNAKIRKFVGYWHLVGILPAGAFCFIGEPPLPLYTLITAMIVWSFVAWTFIWSKHVDAFGKYRTRRLSQNQRLHDNGSIRSRA
jgi:hypothetical protein